MPKSTVGLSGPQFAAWFLKRCDTNDWCLPLWGTNQECHIQELRGLLRHFLSFCAAQTHFVETSTAYWPFNTIITSITVVIVSCAAAVAGQHCPCILTPPVHCSPAINIHHLILWWFIKQLLFHNTLLHNLAPLEPLVLGFYSSSQGVVDTHRSQEGYKLCFTYRPPPLPPTQTRPVLRFCTVLSLHSIVSMSGCETPTW